MFGYSGDIRFLGAAGAGPLPLDRTHDIKVFGYVFGQRRPESVARPRGGVRRAAHGACRAPDLWRTAERSRCPSRGAGFATSERLPDSDAVDEVR